MTFNFRQWMDIVDGNIQEKKIKTEKKDCKCGCKLYTCNECFPENFTANTKITHMSEVVSAGDYVNISETAGGGRGTVEEVLGEMVRVKREDNISILIHESDIVAKEDYDLHELATDDNASFDLYCEYCEKLYGRVKGRSKFLAMDPNEREQVLQDMRSQLSS